MDVPPRFAQVRLGSLRLVPAMRSPTLKLTPMPALLRPMVSPTALIACVLLATACNDYPVHSLLDSFEARVTAKLSHDKPIKLDFLWVVDHSASMCGHQVDMAHGFSTFIKQLQDAGQIDAQMAVVTIQQLPDSQKAGDPYVAKVGAFMNTPAKSFPPNCIERFIEPCTDDSQCQKGTSFPFKNPATCSGSTMCTDAKGTLGAAASLTQTFTNAFQSVSCNGDPSCQWRCKKTANANITTNDNCSINTYCWRHCKNDQECRDVFEPNVAPADQKMKCYSPGGTASDQSGCQFPPPTDDCPSGLPAVLSSAYIGVTVDAGGNISSASKVVPLDAAGNAPKGAKKVSGLDLFHCIATVGASQTPESQFEGGLRSAWLALDPNGPNCALDPKTKLPIPAQCQYSQLVRKDAYLVIVVVSDDDDCSVNLDLPLKYDTPEDKAAVKKMLPVDVWNKCQQYGDAVGGNDWLNEGNCEYRKGKGTPAPITACPCDCRAMDQSSQAAKDCWSTVQAEWLKFAKIDWRFEPVNTFVNKFRSLKDDPAKVIFAVVTGFSNAGLPDVTPKSWADGVSMYESLLHNQAPGAAPYVCMGTRGNAGFGTRFVQLAEAFGENGVVANICAGDNFGGQLKQIGDNILLNVVKQCLDQPPAFNAKGVPQIAVTLVRKGAKIPLTYTPDCAKAAASGVKDKFYCLKDSADCLAGKAQAAQGQGQQSCTKTRDCAEGLHCQDGLCKVYSQAIYFPQVLQPGDEVEINYGADMGL